MGPSVAVAQTAFYFQSEIVSKCPCSAYVRALWTANGRPYGTKVTDQTRGYSLSHTARAKGVRSDGHEQNIVRRLIPVSQRPAARRVEMAPNVCLALIVLANGSCQSMDR